MKIKIWDREDRLVNTIEVSDEEIDHFIDRFGERFGKAFGEAIVKGLDAED